MSSDQLRTLGTQATRFDVEDNKLIDFRMDATPEGRQPVKGNRNKTVRKWYNSDLAERLQNSFSGSSTPQITTSPTASA